MPGAKTTPRCELPEEGREIDREKAGRKLEREDQKTSKETNVVSWTQS